MRQVREEQTALRPDPEAVVTGEVLGQMTYTRQVVREILRFRPPAPMVPQVRRAPVPTLQSPRFQRHVKSLRRSSTAGLLRPRCSR